MLCRCNTVHQRSWLRTITQLVAVWRRHSYAACAELQSLFSGFLLGKSLFLISRTYWVGATTRATIAVHCTEFVPVLKKCGYGVTVSRKYSLRIVLFLLFALSMSLIGQSLDKTTVPPRTENMLDVSAEFLALALMVSGLGMAWPCLGLIILRPKSCHLIVYWK